MEDATGGNVDRRPRRSAIIPRLMVRLYKVQVLGPRLQYPGLPTAHSDHLSARDQVVSPDMQRCVSSFICLSCCGLSSIRHVFEPKRPLPRAAPQKPEASPVQRLIIQAPLVETMYGGPSIPPDLDAIKPVVEGLGFRCFVLDVPDSCVVTSKDGRLELETYDAFGDAVGVMKCPALREVSISTNAEGPKYTIVSHIAELTNLTSLHYVSDRLSEVQVPARCEVSAQVGDGLPGQLKDCVAQQLEASCGNDAEGVYGWSLRGLEVLPASLTSFTVLGAFMPAVSAAAVASYADGVFLLAHGSNAGATGGVLSEEAAGSHWFAGPGVLNIPDRGLLSTLKDLPADLTELWLTVNEMHVLNSGPTFHSLRTLDLRVMTCSNESSTKYEALDAVKIPALEVLAVDTDSKDKDQVALCTIVGDLSRFGRLRSFAYSCEEILDVGACWL
ncbi:hypothetical protein WJX72_004734 [[Myrmecia] bisecta]|uniref:Uncharacterized protein n=1 Tax=[Myrmecia] bisecta TaxID=41462 RepID=A0AAW1PST3_9CHLO